MIELIVVIAVITLIAGMIAPKVVALTQGQRSRNFLTGVRDMSVSARNEAINRGVTMSMTFDSSSNQLTVAMDTTVAQSNTATQPTIDVDVPTSNLVLPEGTTIQTYKLGSNDSTASDWKLRFFPNGRADGGGFEIVQDGRVRSWIVAPDGSNRMQEGSYPDQIDTIWQAGDYARRS